MLSILAKLLKALNSDDSPSQIGLAVAFAAIMGLTPTMSLHNLLVLFFILLVRINWSIFLVAWAGFSAIAYLFDPWLHQLGLWALSLPELQNLWTDFYNQPVGRLSHFNNTLVMGSLIMASLLFIPLVFIVRFLVMQYREQFMAWVEKTKLMGFLKSTKFYEIYSALAN